jgi:hypothetical protein
MEMSISLCDFWDRRCQITGWGYWKIWLRQLKSSRSECDACDPSWSLSFQSRRTSIDSNCTLNIHSGILTWMSLGATMIWTITFCEHR